MTSFEKLSRAVAIVFQGKVLIGLFFTVAVGIVGYIVVISESIVDDKHSSQEYRLEIIESNYKLLLLKYINSDYTHTGSVAERLKDKKYVTTIDFQHALDVCYYYKYETPEQREGERQTADFTEFCDNIREYIDENRKR